MNLHFANDATKVVVLALLGASAMPTRAQDKPKVSGADDVKALAAKATPKTTDGHPDLSGRWVALDTGQPTNVGGRIDGKVHDLYFGTPIPGANPDTDAVTTLYDMNTDGVIGLDGEGRRKAREAIAKPSYKSEFQAKVDMMGQDVNHYDPTLYTCLPPGVPRIGAPGQIVETPGQVIFLYPQSGGANPYSTYRVIPTDGRAHRTGADYDPNPMGDPVGHWEGGTLVIDTTGFDDSTWFGRDGYFHTDAMHVTERFTRKGDTLGYSATVEDPNVLTKPFDVYSVPLTLKKGGPDDILYNGDYPCDISDPAHDFRAHADHKNHV